MENLLVKEYTEQGLNRLAKEKLVTIISNLQNMPAELAMKVSEHIPEFFNTCDRALNSTDSLYREAIEQNERLAQQEIDSLNQRAERYEEYADKATASEEKEKYSQKATEARREIADIRAKVLEDRNTLIKERGKFYMVVLGVMAATLGVTIKVGKKFK